MDDTRTPRKRHGPRRKVLGNAWVDHANAGKTPFNADFQDFITRYAWGEIWPRPHFDERTRRVLVIGTMVALANGTDSACMCARRCRRRLFRRRHQGNHHAAGDLLRRAGRQSRLQGSRRGDRGSGKRQRGLGAGLFAQIIPARCAHSAAARRRRDDRGQHRDGFAGLFRFDPLDHAQCGREAREPECGSVRGQ